MHISPEVKKRFPGIKLVAYQLSNVRYSSGSNYVKKLLSQVKAYLDETPEFFDSDIIKNYNVLAGRSCGRESKVSLLARLLLEGAFPENNDIVDIVNLMQVYEGVVASVYDYEKVDGEPVLTVAPKDYVFETGGTKLLLAGREMVISDDSGVLSLVPCYDSSRVYVDKKTSEILLVVVGHASISRGQLIDAMTSIVQRILFVSGGKISSMVYLD